jgi:hypothetical protein
MTSQVIAICAVLTLLWVAVGVGFVLREELITGQTYSPAVVFGDSRMVFRNSTPNTYWTYILFYLAGVLMALSSAMLGLREVVIEQKRKCATTVPQGKAQRDNILLIVCALACLGLLLSVGLLIRQANH